MNETALANLVLRELRVFERGQPTNGEYIQTAIDEYQAYYAELKNRNLAFWDQATIPVEAGRYVAVLVANRLSNEFGKNQRFRERLAYDADGRGNHQSAMQMLTTVSLQSDARSDEEPEDF